MAIISTQLAVSYSELSVSVPYSVVSSPDNLNGSMGGSGLEHLKT